MNYQSWVASPKYSLWNIAWCINCWCVCVRICMRGCMIVCLFVSPFCNVDGLLLVTAILALKGVLNVVFFGVISIFLSIIMLFLVCCWGMLSVAVLFLVL